MAVGGFSERLAFILEMDPSNAVAGMRRVGDAADRELGKTDDRLNRVGGSMQRVGAGMVAAAGVAVTGLVKLAQASEEAAAESRKLDQAMATNASFAAEGRESFDDLAASLQDLTGADGDAITGMLGFLGTLGRTADEAQRAAPLIVDLAKRFGLELEPAARLVNNAIEGNSSRLERLIGPIGETEGAIDALSRTVGGFAEREAQTFSGQLEILKQNLGDVAEGVGGGVVSAFNDLLGPVMSVTEQFTELAPSTQNAAGKLLAFGTAGVGVIGTASFLTGTVLKMGDNFTRAAESMNLSANAASNLKTGLAAAGVAAAGLAAVVVGIQAINEEARRMGGELGDSARQTAMAADSYDEFAGTIDRITAGIEDLSRTRQSSSAPWDADYRRQLLEGQFALEDQRGALLAVRQEIEALAASRNISLDAATEEVLSTRQAEAAHADLVATLGEDEAAEIEAAEARAEGTAATDAATEAIERNREAKRQQLEATLAQFDADLQYADSQRQTADAIQAATGATDDAATASNEVAAAYDNAARQALAQAAAAVEVANKQAGGAITAQQAAQIQITELARVRDGLAPGSPLRVYLDGYIAQLERTNRTFTSTFQQEFRGTPGAIGGVVKFSAVGGYAGADNPPSSADTIPTMLSPGEFVIRKSAADKLGSGALNALNDGRLPAVGIPTASSGGGASVVLQFGDMNLYAQKIDERSGDQIMTSLEVAIRNGGAGRLLRALGLT